MAPRRKTTPRDPELQKDVKNLLRSKRALIEKPKSKKAKRRAARPDSPQQPPKIDLPQRADYDREQVRENGPPPPYDKRVPQRTPLQRRLDDAAIARMVFLGYTQQEIATRLGLSASTVYSTLSRLDDIIAERALEDLQKQRAAQSMQLDALLHECLEGIKESKKPLVSTTSEVTGPNLTGAAGKDNKDGKPAAAQLAGRQRVVKRTTERTADVNYLFASTDVIKTKMKLLGTSAPVELRMVHEAQQGGLKAVMDAVLAEVKDPDVLARIVSRVEASNSVAEIDESALSDGEDYQEEDADHE